MVYTINSHRGPLTFNLSRAKQCGEFLTGIKVIKVGYEKFIIYSQDLENDTRYLLDLQSCLNRMRFVISCYKSE